MSDPGDALRDAYPLQIAAAAKGMGSDPGDAGQNLQFPDLRQLFPPGRILNIIVPHVSGAADKKHAVFVQAPNQIISAVVRRMGHNVPVCTVHPGRRHHCFIGCDLFPIRKAASVVDIRQGIETDAEGPVTDGRNACGDAHLLEAAAAGKGLTSDLFYAFRQDQALQLIAVQKCKASDPLYRPGDPQFAGDPAGFKSVLPDLLQSVRQCEVSINGKGKSEVSDLFQALGQKDLLGSDLIGSGKKGLFSDASDALHHHDPGDLFGIVAHPLGGVLHRIVPHVPAAEDDQSAVFGEPPVQTVAALAGIDDRDHILGLADASLILHHGRNAPLRLLRQRRSGQQAEAKQHCQRQGKPLFSSMLHWKHLRFLMPRFSFAGKHSFFSRYQAVPARSRRSSNRSSPSTCPSLFRSAQDVFSSAWSPARLLRSRTRSKRSTFLSLLASPGR